MPKNISLSVFLSCLEFAVLNSLYNEVILKPKQVICLEKVFLNTDVLAVLPTGFGKSLIFCLIPALLFAKKFGVQNDGDISSIVIVISPLNALISDQISRLNKGVIRASALDVKLSKIESDNPDENSGPDSELVCDVNQSEKA